MRILKFSYLSILVFSVFLASAFLPGMPVRAQNGKTISETPTLKQPIGTIISTTPTYTWTRLTGAANYQYQVFQGNIKVVDKYIHRTKCGTSICSQTPDYTLGFNVYKWRVRAMMAGVWQNWSIFKYFTVSPPSFSSDFNGSTLDWKKIGSPNWSISSTEVITHGEVDRYASLYRTTGRYTDFEFSARVKRINSNGNSCMAFRMGSSIDPTFNDWYPGYWFCLAEDWQFFVLRIDSPTSYTFLYDFQPSSAIRVNDWNVLNMAVVGNTFNFYINNSWVAKITDDTYKRGFVGFTMYKNTSDSTSFNVDWARLIVILKGFEYEQVLLTR